MKTQRDAQAEGHVDLIRSNIPVGSPKARSTCEDATAHRRCYRVKRGPRERGSREVVEGLGLRLRLSADRVVVDLEHLLGSAGHRRERNKAETQTLDILLYASLSLLASERVPEEISGDRIQACCLEVEHAREGERAMNTMLSQSGRNFFPEEVDQ